MILRVLRHGFHTTTRFYFTCCNETNASADLKRLYYAQLSDRAWLRGKISRYTRKHSFLVERSFSRTIPRPSSSSLFHSFRSLSPHNKSTYFSLTRIQPQRSCLSAVLWALLLHTLYPAAVFIFPCDDHGQGTVGRPGVRNTNCAGYLTFGYMTKADEAGCPFWLVLTHFASAQLCCAFSAPALPLCMADHQHHAH